MKTYLLVLFSLITISLSAQSKESYQVINLLGATIYSEPNFDSQIVGLVEVGNKIYVDKTLEKKVKKPISADLELEGNWFQIILDSNVGYVFSGDFSAKTIARDSNPASFEELNMFGKELEKKEYTEQTVIDGESYPVEKIVTAYEFALINETLFDDCHDWEYLLEDFTLSEAYHQLINLTSRKYTNQIEIPATISRKGNVWNFSDLDAIQELKLHDLGDGKFKITLYSCT